MDGYIQTIHGIPTPSHRDLVVKYFRQGNWAFIRDLDPFSFSDSRVGPLDIRQVLKFTSQQDQYKMAR